jgi:hypothetical protein
MKYFVTHTTGTWIEAETEEIAQAELCRLIRENIEPSHCCIDGEDDSNDMNQFHRRKL